MACFLPRSGAGAHANWHRVALQTATEERAGRGAAAVQGPRAAEEEPRTPAYGGGASQHRRRSPV